VGVWGQLEEAQVVGAGELEEGRMARVEEKG